MIYQATDEKASDAAAAFDPQYLCPFVLEHSFTLWFAVYPVEHQDDASQHAVTYSISTHKNIKGWRESRSKWAEDGSVRQSYIGTVREVV